MKSPSTTACEYGPIGFGAFSVTTAFLIDSSSIVSTGDERRILDIAQVGTGELHVRRAHILLETRELLRPGDRDDPRLLREQPGKRDLRRRRGLCLRHALQQVDQRHVRGTGVRGEARGNAVE